MILLGPGGQAFIQSFAHGGRRFTFERIAGQQGAADQSLFEFTDLANAHRIAKAFGDGLIATATGWFCFDGKHWKKGDHFADEQALNLSRLVLQDTGYLELIARIERNDFGTDGETKANKLKSGWLTFAESCENKHKMAAALNLARTLLWRDMSEMNVDPWLLNVTNGTIDLRTGIMRSHDRDDLITALAPVEYDPAATCPVFEKTLLEIFGDDVELASFLQRYLGYCLTGITTEQKILIPWGDGSNGKTTILGIVQRVLGRDYCGSAAPKLLEATKTDRHPTEIADLYGKRIVIASETEEGAQLREAFLKLATGGDPLKGRFMHKDFFEFEPTHKFILLTNHKPEVKGSDYAIWRRLLLLPFEIIFGDEKAIATGDASRLKDKTLPDKLLAERDGILAWMIRGCGEWREKGLAEPSKVLGATAEYRQEQDRIAQFLAEECECDPQSSVSQASLYRIYKDWTGHNGYHPFGVGKFRTALLKAMRGKVIVGRTTSGPAKGCAEFRGIKDRTLH
jgi:putative DNA primase/helicase